MNRSSGSTTRPLTPSRTISAQEPAPVAGDHGNSVGPRLDRVPAANGSCHSEGTTTTLHPLIKDLRVGMAEESHADENSDFIDSEEISGPHCRRAPGCRCKRRAERTIPGATARL